MSVTVKMISAMEDEISNCYQPNVAAQAVINAAWIEFDPDDESTWPNDDVFKDWYLDIEGTPVVSTFGTHKTDYPKHWRGVLVNYNIKIGKSIRYADPIDLLYVHKTEEINHD